jgi:hypothetical protein
MTKNLMPNMAYYIDTLTPGSINSGRKNVYGNWWARRRTDPASLPFGSSL